MKIELNKIELTIIAKALNAYAMDALENAENQKKLKDMEIAGRKLCSKFMAAVNPKTEGGDVDRLFFDARMSFCGIASDDEF